MTPKQLAFVAGYALTRNGARAAVMAGYSSRTAAAAASRLRKCPEVARAIARLRGTQPSGPTPLAYLLSVMRDEYASTPRRVRAAVVAARYLHAKAPSTKKDRATDKAQSALSGKFAPSAGPQVIPIRPPADPK